MENTSLRTSAKLLSFSLFLSLSSLAYAGPTGETVVSGEITVSRPTSTATQITQATDKGIIHWQDFSIGANESVAFHQPGVTSITLNRVTGTNPSSILGQLTANGQIILINRAGVLFGANARVDVAGLIATTANITNEDFQAGLYRFNQEGTTPAGQILQQGKINAAPGGAVVLVAPNVTNEGLIQAEAGQVALGSGTAYTVALTGDQLLQFAVDPTQMQAVNAQGEVVPLGVTQAGQIFANGGSVLLSTQAVHSSLNQVISHTGITEAKTLQNRNGEIILSGRAGTEIQVSGQLTATGEQAGQKGGTIKILAPKISVGTTAPAQLNVSGKAGGGTILIGGNLQGKGPEPNAKQVMVGTQTVLQANATENGNGGTIVAYSKGATAFHGSSEAKGGSNGGNGGTVETSGHQLDVSGAKVDTSASHGEVGTWLLDPWDIIIDDSQTLDPGFTADPEFWLPTQQPSFITSSLIKDTLAFTNVTITTSADGGEGAGDITINSPLNFGSAAVNNTLTFLANNDIRVNAPIIKTSGTGNLILRADSDASGTSSNNGNGGTIFFGAEGGIDWLGDGKVSLFYNPVSGTYSSPHQGGNDFMGKITSGSHATAYMLINDVGSESDTVHLGLQAMRDNSSGNYALGTNIDASATSSWNGGIGFTPVGSAGGAFTGVLEGNNHQIMNLTINRVSDDGMGSNIGLFGVTDGATIQNIGLSGSGSISGFNYVGAVVGKAVNTRILNVVNTLPIISHQGLAGGLVGRLEGSNGLISNSYNTGSISNTESGDEAHLFGSVGGLVGSMEGSRISGSYNSGTINVSSYNQNIGGLVGSMENSNSRISGSYNSGTIIVGSYNQNIGGLVGFMLGGSISKSNNRGALGDSMTGGKISNSSNIGGLVGAMSGGSISDSNNIEAINLSVNNQNIGGLVGLVAVSPNGSSIFHSYNNGELNAIVMDGSSNDSYIGGIVGRIDDPHGSLVDVFNSGSINNMWDTSFVGGLVGSNAGTIFNSYNIGTVNGYNYLGGLVGSNTGKISVSYNTGTVSGTTYLGGLAGSNAGTIANAYNTGIVTSGRAYSGGIAGSNTGTIQNTYQAGGVTPSGSNTEETPIGDFVGDNQRGVISQSYFVKAPDSTSIGVGSGSNTGLTGVEVDQLMEQATFVGWDFNRIWAIDENNSTPYFSLRNPENPGGNDQGQEAKTVDPLKIFPSRQDFYLEKGACVGSQALSWQCLKLELSH